MVHIISLGYTQFVIHGWVSYYLLQSAWYATLECNPKSYACVSGCSTLA